LPPLPHEIDLVLGNAYHFLTLEGAHPILEKMIVDKMKIMLKKAAIQLRSNDSLDSFFFPVVAYSGCCTVPSASAE
jgi:hypothetical protein